MSQYNMTASETD